MRPHILLTIVLLPACGDSSPDSNDNAQCEEGFRPEGPACVPIFDDCPGPAEIPVLGGGCQPVGVTECASGFESDGEGGCEPILPSEPCPPGTMEMIGHTECQPVGVIDCGDGFVSDGEGGCDAILPDGPCPWGYMEILGYTECQPIGDCGTGTWGVIEIDATTVFVDASADATAADGTQGAPFVTIQDAYDVVVPGGQIAVAAGEYEERLEIDKEVRLTGRCAELVTIRGEWLVEPRPPVRIGANGSGTTIRGVSLTGDVEGLEVVGALGVSVEEVQIVDAGEIGLFADNADISIFKVVASANHMKGIELWGTEAEISSVVVRDTQPQQSDGMFGIGIYAICDPYTGVCGSLRLDHAVLRANRVKGIELWGTEAEISSVVVRDTLPDQSDATLGIGIYAACTPDRDVCSSLRLNRAVLRANHTSGIALWGTEAEISSVVVRDTLPQQSDDALGVGLKADCHTETAVCGSLRLNNAILRANHAAGIALWGTDAELSSVVVRDTLPRQSDDALGTGIVATCDPATGVCVNLRLNHALLCANRILSIALFGTESDLSSVVVRDTLPQQSDDTGGYGLQTECDPDTGVCGSLRLNNAILRANHAAGIALWGTDAELSSVVVRDTLPRQSDDTSGYGLLADCNPDTGTCGSLRFDQALLRANHTAGIALWGTEAEISSVVIRDTQPQQSDNVGGVGLQVACDLATGVCGSLQAIDSLIQRSEIIGIVISGVPALLSGVAVVDTRQNEEGDFAGKYGTSVSAMCDEVTFNCASLDMTTCSVDSSFTAGVAVQGVSGSIQGSVVRQVIPRALDGAFGYGIQVEGVPGALPTVFDVSDSLIQDAALAGILYYLAGGTVSGSQVSGGQYTIVMNQGANPIIMDDNDLSGSIESEPEWSSMEPSPTPAPAIPADIDPIEP
ncbi:hypothetical protein ACFL51_00510 [Myxococcota bacterium]